MTNRHTEVTTPDQLTGIYLFIPYMLRMVILGNEASYDWSILFRETS